jgi:hypothetical protein
MTSDQIFSRGEIRAAAGFVVLYAALAIGAQVLTPEDTATPQIRLRLRPPVSASAAEAAASVVDAVPLAGPTVDQVGEH